MHHRSVDRCGLARKKLDKGPTIKGMNDVSFLQRDKGTTRGIYSLEAFLSVLH